ncbi:hypothetical protein ACTXP0_00200 [Psychrobacter celer]|uniref:hypothetical protein n=1 Tax=Psychrobacter celer TaxID=306572 RepID=UPI003FCFCCE4
MKYPVGWVMPPHHKNCLSSNTHLPVGHAYNHGTDLTCKLIKSPNTQQFFAMMCVLLVGVKKKPCWVLAKNSNPSYKANYRNSCAVFYHITPHNLQRFMRTNRDLTTREPHASNRRIKKSDTIVSLFTVVAFLSLFVEAKR